MNDGRMYCHAIKFISILKRYGRYLPHKNCACKWLYEGNTHQVEPNCIIPLEKDHATCSDRLPKQQSRNSKNRKRMPKTRRPLRLAVGNATESGVRSPSMRLRSGKEVSEGAVKRKRPSETRSKTSSDSPRLKHKRGARPRPEIMAEPAETLEDEARRVDQELQAARAELRQLSTALDELEASDDPNPRRLARLEDQFDNTNAIVKRLNEKLSDLNQQLSKKRNLDLNREELNLHVERETRELELKRQRIELQEQEQKQTAPTYASALEWVRATQPCKDPPPGPPDVLMPSDNTIPRIARRKEMRKIWRLLRKAAREGRIPMSFLHGGPGAGKTFTAYHLMKKDPKDLAKLGKTGTDLRDFAQATQFVAVSFNNMTPVQEGRESRWMMEYNEEVPVSVRLLFQFVNSRETSFAVFAKAIDTALSRGELSQEQLGLFQVVRTILPDFDGPLVLIVDEIAKLDKGDDRHSAERMRSAICAMMNEQFMVLFTSLSDEIMKEEHTSSHREVEKIQLSALPEKACARLFFKELDQKTLMDSNRRQQVDKHDMALSMARMCWGHPRSLEVLVAALRIAAPNQRVNDLISEAVNAIRANYTSVTAYPISLLKLVLLAVNVTLKDTVQLRPGAVPVQWDDLIASGYLVNSTDNSSFIPHISELMLRGIVAMYASPEVTPPEARKLMGHLRLLLGLLGFNFEWRLFEKLNLYWELVHRECTGMRPDLFAAISVKDYYKTPYGKGILTETLINVIDPLDGEQLFPDVAGVVLVPGPKMPGLTSFVWYPGVDNFPGLDSVYFVRKADGSGILPLVFQVKFSDHASSTVLDRRTVETAYANTKKSMEASGWAEFVLIVSAWRDVAKNLLEDPPENVMILTRDTLSKQFGCLGAVVRTVHLRDVILTPAAANESDDEPDDEPEQPGGEQKQEV